ncbi:hypothetical protein ACHAW5_005679 [Stephanodiscus triporus]|uniref:Uncharacterized protein n=1 Tax=Stephanodiscus triporus TaxID=2934178 RepID=A0ABD3NS30_9STRA
MNLAKKRDSAYDFEFPRQIKDALSIAPSRAAGGGSGSVCSRSQFNPRPWASIGGSDSFSVAASTSMSQLANRNERINGSLDGRNNKSPTDTAASLEKEINQLIAKTITLRKEGKLEEALECAKEGTKKEHLLRKHRKAHSLSGGPELMHSSWFNLAMSYEYNDMPDDAIKTYTYLVNQRGNPFTGRLRINMGNVHYRQKQYPSAIRMYKMALDQMRKDEKSTVHRIRRNIGNAYFRMGKIRDAVKYFDEAMETVPDFQTGFNLLVCHLALGDMDRAKTDFVALVDIPSDKDAFASKEDEISVGGANVVHGEKDEPATSSKQSNHFLQTAARLIAPMLDSSDWAAGYDWVCNALGDRHEELSVQLKLEQATQRLHHKDFDVAIKTLKTLQKKGREVKSASATNLSFVSFLEGNIERASEYADIALASDRYNAKALVNKGNCLFVNGDFTTAKDLYLEAIGVQADCSQAIFNLGLANAQLGLAEEAIHAFKQVHGIIPNDPQVLFQIADIFDLQGKSHDAMKWFNVLAARVQSDPVILAKLGQLYAEAKDDSQGLHYQLESFRHYPTDLDVISWIGTWFVQQEMYERQKKSNGVSWLRVPTRGLRCLIATCEVVGKASFAYQDRLDKLLSESEQFVKSCTAPESKH